jgi:O-antigen biosynthesis protein
VGDRVRVDGKFFALGGRRFPFRGVTYGTFEPRGDGARYPERLPMKHHFAAMSEAGFSVVRTYTAPPDDVIDLAADRGMHLLPGAFYPDWRYLLGASRRDGRRVAHEAAAEVRAVARRLSGCEQILGLSLGNEVPADVLRWYGTDAIVRTINELVAVVREEDPELLVTYGNYPSAEYLPLHRLDFLTFNVFLERRGDLRRYLTRLHHIAGDRPLVLGEVGLDAGLTPESEQRQADVLDWQLETVLERGVAGSCVFSWTDDWWVGDARVEGWHFGLTRTDGTPRPALDVAAGWNQRTVADLDVDWPSISVVVCAYNAAATLDECLRYTCALDYPNLEIIVVDDGSQDATAAIAGRHARVRLLCVEHGGLAVARNEGIRAAKNEIVAYLDSDAYPSLEWPYYLALGFDGPDVGGVGGPNVPPPGDPIGAHVVARSPGGPVHVLMSDDRAEHIPGCNMAFWKDVLSEVGGFDPIFDAAGDDVDLCWKVLDRSWAIGFHPAALVWHHRRPGLRAYLRQQSNYGRSEALVEARHPNRFTSTGAAAWRGRIYNSIVPSQSRQRVYRGPFGTAAYQSVYGGGGYVLDLAHQVGVPAASVLLPTAALGLLSPWLLAPAASAIVFLAVLAILDLTRTLPPRDLAQGALRFRGRVAVHHLLQPLVRAWSRRRHRGVARRNLDSIAPLPPPVRWLATGIALLIEDRPRAELAASLIEAVRRCGVRAVNASEWEDYDSRLLMSAFVHGDLQTSSHPAGFVQVRIRRRLRWRRLLAAVLIGAAAAAFSPLLALIFGAAVLGEVGRGIARCRTVLAHVFAGLESVPR